MIDAHHGWVMGRCLYLLIRFGEEDADNESADTSVTVFVFVLLFHILACAMMGVTIC